MVPILIKYNKLFEMGGLLRSSSSVSHFIGRESDLSKATGEVVAE